MHFRDVALEIVKEYNLNNIVHKVWVHEEIRKGSWRLPQANILANELLEKRL